MKYRNIVGGNDFQNAKKCSGKSLIDLDMDLKKYFGHRGKYMKSMSLFAWFLYLRRNYLLVILSVCTFFQALEEKAKSVTGVIQWPYRAVAKAVEIIPKTLIQNCGVNSIRTLTALRVSVN